jgi:hypothetical protein
MESVQSHCQIGEQEPSHMASRGAFVVHGQPTKGAEPGEGALNHPAFGDRHEAAGGVPR